jgi:hypothetical protein
MDERRKEEVNCGREEGRTLWKEEHYGRKGIKERYQGRISRKDTKERSVLFYMVLY